MYDPVTYAIPFFMLMMGIEWYVNYKERLDLFETKDSLASIGMGIGSLIIDLGMKAIGFAVYYFFYQFALFDIGWQWWVWILLLFVDDFTFYWHHRLSHEIRVLWAAHVNHHSSQRYNLSTALRQSWTELLYKYFWWIWLPLIGFHPIMIMMMQSISLVYQFWIHTEIIKTLPKPIEYFFNTPAHHRIHHASNIRYLDKNHGGILIIWDRLFGTFIEEDPNEPVVYGIRNNINTFNPFKIASHEFIDLSKDMKSSKTWKDFFLYLIKPPGWQPDNPFMTTKYLQKEMED